MLASIQYNEQTYKVDLSKPMDISLPIKIGGVKAWYVDEPTFEPVKMGNWIGSKTRWLCKFQKCIFQSTRTWNTY